MIATHHPCMVTLLKNKMINHGSLMNDFGFTDMIEVPTEGQSGGIAVLWDTTLVNVNSFVRRNNKIHALIEVPPIDTLGCFHLYMLVQIKALNT